MTLDRLMKDATEKHAAYTMFSDIGYLIVNAMLVYIDESNADECSMPCAQLCHDVVLALSNVEA